MEEFMNLNVTKIMANARIAMTENAFQQVGSVVSDAKNVAREEAQVKTSSEMKNILDKLQSGEPITSLETALIRAWVIGDADSYAKMENNFQDWLTEYERLEKTLAGYEGKDCSSNELLKLHAILEDAARVSYDIANFLEKKERVDKFDSAMADGLDDDERDLLLSVLTNQLHSPYY
jgi:hypothetical protein